MINVNFTGYTTYTVDTVTQWDVNRTLRITGLSLSVAPTIYFGNKKSITATGVKATRNGDVITCKIPNALLTESYPIYAHIQIKAGGETKTIETIKIPVIAAKEPDNYVFYDNIPVVTYASLETEIERLRAAVGSPLVANAVSDMQDETKVYVYTGQETGYTAGNWYYYDGTEWTSGGVYQSVAFETDTDLDTSGAAADAKATGDAIIEVKNELDFTRGGIFNWHSGSDYYEVGRILASSGISNKTDALAQKRFITKNFLSGYDAIKVNDGYFYRVYAYNKDDDSYVGLWNGDSFAAEATDYKLFSPFCLYELGDYKFIVQVERVVSGADMSPEDFSNALIIQNKYDETIQSNIRHIEELTDYLKTGRAQFALDGTSINAYIAAGDGKLVINGDAKYKAKFYDIVPGKKYKIKSTGNRLVYGICDSIENNIHCSDYYAAEADTEEVSQDHYITNTGGNYLVVYYNYNTNAICDADVQLVIEPEIYEKNHLNILVLGNSYSADSWQYVPFILKNYGITVNLYVYYRGSGSIYRLYEEWEETDANGTDEWGASHIRRMYHIDTRSMARWASAESGYSPKMMVELANSYENDIDEWDIISLQTGGRSGMLIRNPDDPTDPRKGPEPYVRKIIKLINESYTKKYTLGWFCIYTGFDGKNRSGYKVLTPEECDNRVDSLRAAEALCKSEPFGIIFPAAAAVFNARTNSALASTDISAVGNLWYSDKLHLQSGIPCYVANAAVVQAIFNKFYPEYSILNDETIITDDFITNKNLPAPSIHGSVMSTDGELYKLAQKCAVIACNYPFDMTGIYGDDDNTQLNFLSDETRYWADSLIDTTGI